MEQNQNLALAKETLIKSHAWPKNFTNKFWK